MYEHVEFYICPNFTPDYLDIDFLLTLSQNHHLKKISY